MLILIIFIQEENVTNDFTRLYTANKEELSNEMSYIRVGDSKCGIET